MLFSEPKIPQRVESRRAFVGDDSVSVLFSEPKIPQRDVPQPTRERAAKGFSALQRAENSSTGDANVQWRRDLRVSVLFSEPKIPQHDGARLVVVYNDVSVLFSEPKIPQQCSR